jgi:hypothetical protein
LPATCRYFKHITVVSSRYTIKASRRYLSKQHNQKTKANPLKNNHHASRLQQQQGRRRHRQVRHLNCKSSPNINTRSLLKLPSLTKTPQLGNAVGGITKTAGGIVGTAGRGVGDTINNTTGTKAVGDGLQGLTGGIENAGNTAGKGAENAGQWKKP